MTASTSKEFHLGDLLSVTTGVLVSPTHMNGVAALIDHVTGQKHMTHQLPRASREITGYLIEQFPWLGDLAAPEGADRVELSSWLSRASAEHGTWHDVEPMQFGQYVGREPDAEIREARPDATIIEFDEKGTW